MGDQDGAANRMKIAGHNALKGHLGYFGGLGLQLLEEGDQAGVAHADSGLDSIGAAVQQREALAAQVTALSRSSTREM